MNAVNAAATAVFDVLMSAFDWMGPSLALILVSGLFGILALIAFKHISFQRGIKSVKDKIKGAMIEIRLYQHDLGIVAKAVGKVLGRNVQYLGLNFGPILPLLVPFTLVAAQLVVRNGFAPLPLWTEARGEWQPGKGHVVTVELDEDSRELASDVVVELPSTLQLKSEIVRSATKGRVWFEVVAVESGVADIVFRTPDGQAVTKQVVTGAAPLPRSMQSERTASFWESWLWPAEDTLSGTPFERIAFVYPERDLPWLPDGPLMIVGVFFAASMAFGIAVLKPLGITI
jgi:hypothetical protein